MGTEDEATLAALRPYQPARPQALPRRPCRAGGAQHDRRFAQPAQRETLRQALADAIACRDQIRHEAAGLLR